MNTPTTTTDAGGVPTHLVEAAKLRDEKRKAMELADLADKANKAHSLIVNAPKIVLGHAITAGEALNLAKDRAGNGNWLKWLEDNCPEISDRTAERYMKLANGKTQLEKKLDQSIFDTMSNLTINEALRLLEEGQQPEQQPEAQTEGQGDAVEQGATKAKKSSNKRGPTPKQQKKQIDDFKSKWVTFTDWQKRSFVDEYKDELAELLEVAVVQVEEETMEEQHATH